MVSKLGQTCVSEDATLEKKLSVNIANDVRPYFTSW